MQAFETADNAALVAAEMLAEGERLSWTLALTSSRRCSTTTPASCVSAGVAAAAQMWTEATSPHGRHPGGRGVRRDGRVPGPQGWMDRVPSWARLPEREAWPWWFVTDLRGLHPQALVESPSSFRRRPWRGVHHQRRARAGMSTGLGRCRTSAPSSTICHRSSRRAGPGPSFSWSACAALAVAYDATRATRDLDAVFVPSEVVREAAAAVAEREGLAEDWLNDALVKGFLPGPDPDVQRFYSTDSLIVDVASPRYLLAMKLFAARAEIDADDIALLYRQLGFTTVDEGLDLVEPACPGRPIPAKRQVSSLPRSWTR